MPGLRSVNPRGFLFSQTARIDDMFFRRERARVPSFDERIDGLRGAGFAVAAEDSGQVRVSRGECAAVIGKDDSGYPRLDRCGIRIGGEMAVIVDAGNQKFLETTSGRRRPALASHLTALHAFTEEVRELLGLKSLYNESLGTVSQSHHYDRVKGRE